MRVDYILVGQGLAGSVLAYELLRRGKDLAIFDMRQFPTASSVAAGLINPFTGPKMVKTWLADQIFPVMHQYYRSAEEALETKFYHEKLIYRPFSSASEVNDWHGRSISPAYASYLAGIAEPGKHSHIVHDPFGGLEIKGAYLETHRFLEAMFVYLKANCHYFEEEFAEDEVEYSGQFVRYKNLKAKRLICCNGYKMIYSRFFDWLPLTPLKGEILEVKMIETFETIYNRACFIIPLGDQTYKVGSTYKNRDLNELPTKEGLDEIAGKMELTCKAPYKLVDQKAGIRPATTSRRPFAGVHPEKPWAAVFNGLGTKGVSLAPFFAQQLISLLEDGNNLHEEVNVKRHYSLYFHRKSTLGNIK